MLLVSFWNRHSVIIGLFFKTGWKFSLWTVCVRVKVAVHVNLIKSSENGPIPQISLGPLPPPLSFLAHPWNSPPHSSLSTRTISGRSISCEISTMRARNRLFCQKKHSKWRFFCEGNDGNYTLYVFLSQNLSNLSAPFRPFVQKFGVFTANTFRVHEKKLVLAVPSRRGEKKRKRTEKTTKKKRKWKIN